MVKVNWRTPIFGLDHIVVIVGLLHNTEAKKTNAPGYTAFFDALADLCAGGGRIVGADLNMAAYGAVNEMAKRGVGLTLLSHHREMANASDDYKETTMQYDSMGLWIVGKFDIERTWILSTADNVFWGAAHPKARDIAPEGYACGYAAKHYKHSPPDLRSRHGVEEVDDLRNALEELRENVVIWNPNESRLKDAFGTAPWGKVHFICIDDLPRLFPRTDRTNRQH